MPCEYTLKVKTSTAFRDAGTDAGVYMQLVNSAGKSTHWAGLDVFWHDDFEEGSTEVYKVQAVDIGMPVIVRIKLMRTLGIKDQWLCETIEVCKDGESLIFPVYNFIVDQYEVCAGEAKILQNETSELVRTMRHREVATNKELFKWLPKEKDLGYRGFPRYLDADSSETAKVPKILRRYSERHNHVTGNRKVALLKDKFQGLLGEMDELSDFNKLYSSLSERGDYLKGWDTDECMGWQMLNGISPMAFEICKEVPSYFNVTDEDVESLLEGKTLADHMEAGKIYISDMVHMFSEENGLVRGTQKDGAKSHCPQSCGLFYINELEQYLPIAIQLVPNDRAYLFTGAEGNSHDWLLAKMYFRCSLANEHKWVYYYFNTHGCMEPFAYTLFRCLPCSHPIYKLLRPHLITVPAINTIAREALLPDDCKLAESMGITAKSAFRKSYAAFNLNDLDMPEQLAKKGLVPENIPSYWYGRDMIKVWKVIEEYCRRMINLYYTCDKDVQDDRELQDWAYETAFEAFGWEDNNSRGCPVKYDSIEHLVKVCKIIIATGAAQHTAVNFNQFEVYRFAPNSPALMRLPPHKRGEATQKRMMESLPNGAQAAVVSSFTYGLSLNSTVEESIGTFTEHWFTDKKALDVQKLFKEELGKLDEELRERNSTLERPYLFQMPSRMPNSIAI